MQGKKAKRNTIWEFVAFLQHRSSQFQILLCWPLVSLLQNLQKGSKNVLIWAEIFLYLSFLEKSCGPFRRTKASITAGDDKQYSCFPSFFLRLMIYGHFRLVTARTPTAFCHFPFAVESPFLPPGNVRFFLPFFFFPRPDCSQRGVEIVQSGSRLAESTLKFW